jgi:hypothetical protein
MTGWYAPGQLLQTGTKVIVSSLLGTRADFRLVESFVAKQPLFDYSSEPEIWIDYVADLGDGWDSTFAVAKTLAAASLQLPSRDGSDTFRTQRGRILVMGGDEVYPTADRDSYQEKLVAPYECALKQSEPPHPHLFAIPGNHDWYDGLVSFTRLFCQGRWVGGWQTQQKRSYFAIKLPARWWLWGVDVQLESDIDQPQLEYFSEVAKQMQAGDRVLLATAEPHWIYGNIYDPKLQKNLAFLEEKVIGDRAKAKLQVGLAGDLHHYRRHEATDGTSRQLVTSGGGGAFLHPTFGPPVESIRVGAESPTTYQLKSEFPDQKTSKRLLLGDLLFPFFNPTFGLLTGALYLAIAWIYREPVAAEFKSLLPDASTSERAGAIVRALLASPAGFFWILVIIGGFWAFTDTHSRPYRYAAGTLHALAHLAGILISSWVGWRAALATSVLPTSIARLLAGAAVTFAVGYVIGSLVMGIYLYVSLRVFRRHANEAFSALHISDYKNFLRLHIDQQGQLTIYPVGIERVPRANSSPADVQSIKPMLIEKPIRMPQ